MKKLFIIIATALCLAGCTKEYPTPKNGAEYSLKMAVPFREIAIQELGRDAQINDKIIFYEYNESNMQVASNVWDNPSVGEEKSFVANANAVKLTVCYEMNGKNYGGKLFVISMWLADVFLLTKGSKTSISFTATSPSTKNNPIK